MITVLEQMLSEYDIHNLEEEKSAIKEIMQTLILSSLSKTGFFKDAIFCGGTALRIFYKVNRFSEDLDFSLVSPNPNYSLEPYLNVVIDLLKEYGINLEVQIKNTDKNVKSAFCKFNTLEQILYFNASFDIKNIRREEKMRIKIEVDTNPPAGGLYEIKTSLQPEIFFVKIYNKETLFAGKIHSLLCRFWDNRIKGRDLYDFLFYVATNTKINIPFLENAMKQSGHLDVNKTLDINEIKTLLINKFNSLDYKLAKKDVLPFVKNKKEIDLWCKELFIDVTKSL